jgi:hypothetical protein
MVKFDESVGSIGDLEAICRLVALERGLGTESLNVLAHDLDGPFLLGELVGVRAKVVEHLFQAELVTLYHHIGLLKVCNLPLVK